MKRRNFITSLSVLAPAALVAPDLLFASSSTRNQPVDAGLLVIGSAEGENPRLQNLLEQEKSKVTYLDPQTVIVKSERTETGFRLYTKETVLVASKIIIDSPAAVDEPAKQIKLGNAGSDSSASLCFSRKNKTDLAFISNSRSRINAEDLRAFTQKKKPALLLLS
jgi:hypothetical protein